MAHSFNGHMIDCCGCGACKQICPVDCISMVADAKGFHYPVLDAARCLHCDRCTKVCPCLNDVPRNDPEPIVYAAIHRNQTIHMNSSSGGAFTAICHAFCDEDSYIYGVDYDANVIAFHDGDTLENIARFRKSKYVQSDTRMTFSQAKEKLDEGKKVVFTGTPCQIAGLRLYLEKPYPNLLTIDVVCHGVASPGVFQRFIKLMEEKEKKRVARVDMRCKVRKGDLWDLINTRIIFRDGTEITDESKNLFTNMYYRNIGYRDCCYDCRYYSVPRIGDITIADCCGIDKFMPSMFDGRGVSLILINNHAMENLIPELEKNMTMARITLEAASAKNQNLRRSTIKPPLEGKYWDDYKKLTSREFFRKYGRRAFKTNIMRAIRIKLLPVIPAPIKRFLKKFLKRGAARG